MRSRKGNIEMLLLLCCLVGVVSFFSLGIAFTNLLFEPQNDSNSKFLVREKVLLEEKEEKESLLKELEQRKKELEAQKREKESLLFDEDEIISKAQMDELERELDRLNKEYDLLVQKIESLKRELASLPIPSEDKDRKEKEREFKILQKRLEELQEMINRASVALANIRKAPEVDLDRKEEISRVELDKIRGEKERLIKEVRILKMREQIGGISKYINPLFVECKERVYIFHPEGEEVAVAQIDKRNIFKERSAGHDIIVFYVRPDGFESFKKAHDKIKTISIARSYEPVETDERLY